MSMWLRGGTSDPVSSNTVCVTALAPKGRNKSANCDAMTCRTSLATFDLTTALKALWNGIQSGYARIVIW